MTSQVNNIAIQNGAWNGQYFVFDDTSPASGKYQWDMVTADNTSREQTGVLHQLEYVVGYGWYVINVDGSCFGDVSPTSATAGTYKDASGNDVSFTSNHASASNGTLTIQHNGGNITISESSFFTNGLPQSGPTVTSGRSSHSGIIPGAVDFTIRDPNPGVWYEKTGAQKFKLKFYDQNEPSGGYNVTIEWTATNNSSKSHTQNVTSASGDYYIELDTSSTGGVKHNSNITVKFNYAVKYQGVSYVVNAAVKTLTYLANGPFSGSFTPSGGNIGQQISVYVRDDNPYPDGPVTVSYKTTNGTTANIVLQQSNTWQVMNSYPIYFTSTEGTAYIYDTDKDSATEDDIIVQASYAVPDKSGGGPRRYPLIMTNLFDRQRSDYAIGKTHKDLNTGNLF